MWLPYWSNIWNTYTDHCIGKNQQKIKNIVFHDHCWFERNSAIGAFFITLFDDLSSSHQQRAWFSIHKKPYGSKTLRNEQDPWSSWQSADYSLPYQVDRGYTLKKCKTTLIITIVIFLFDTGDICFQTCTSCHSMQSVFSVLHLFI